MILNQKITDCQAPHTTHEISKWISQSHHLWITPEPKSFWRTNRMATLFLTYKDFERYWKIQEEKTIETKWRESSVNVTGSSDCLSGAPVRRVHCGDFIISNCFQQMTNHLTPEVHLVRWLDDEFDSGLIAWNSQELERRNQEPCAAVQFVRRRMTFRFANCSGFWRGV